MTSISLLILGAPTPLPSGLSMASLEPAPVPLWIQPTKKHFYQVSPNAPKFVRHRDWDITLLFPAEFRSHPDSFRSSVEEDGASRNTEEHGFAVWQPNERTAPTPSQAELAHGISPTGTFITPKLLQRKSLDSLKNNPCLLSSSSQLFILSIGSGRPCRPEGQHPFLFHV